MNLRFGCIVSIMLLILVTGLALFPAAAAEEKMVSMVYTGEIADHGYIQHALNGVNRAQEEFSFTIHDIPWNSSAPCDPVTDTDGTRSDAVIIMGAFMNGYQQEIVDRNPEVPIILIDGGNLTGPEAKSIYFSMYGASYLAGILAANQTKTGKLGIIIGFDMPTLRGFTDGFTDGAHRVNPDAEVTISYIADDYSGFSMPEQAGVLAEGMYRNGTDIIFPVAGSSGLGVISTAKTLPGLYVIGVDADQSDLAPDTILASAVKNLDPVIYNELGAVFNGSYIPGSVVTGLEDGGTSLILNPRFEHLSPLVESRIPEATEKEKEYLATHPLA